MASPVEAIRKEVSDYLERWTRIRAAVEGEEAIKALGEKIVPRPNPTDQSDDNAKRFTAYLTRAVWYNVTARTLSGLAGFVFKKDPVLELPTTLQPLQDNIDGSGVSLFQQAKAALRTILAFGRAGLLADYPQVQGATTQKDIADGGISPTIVLYQPEQIVNWFVSYKGAKALLDLLVLKETYSSVGENEFEHVVKVQYRVLKRNAGAGVTGHIYRQANDNSPFEEVGGEAYTLKGKTGTPLVEIPFTFLGAVNNDSDVDGSPLLDLVNLNIAHFRNSADYEESCFLVGQPTPWFSGLTKVWVDEVLKGQIQLGSRAAIPLPAGGTAGLLQATPNAMPFEAMKHKELQMVALGAKLVEQREVQRTALEAGMEQTSETSTLTAAASNVFAGYVRALEQCGQFVGADQIKLTFELAEPLTKEQLTPQQATAVAASWMQGLIDFEEARYILKSAGWAFKDDDEVKQNNAAESFDDPTLVPPGQPKPPANTPPAQ
jgi:hypothetical protein